MVISKTDYLLYRECKKNSWMKVHKPDIYFQHKLSDFEKMIIQTGNEVELVARGLFPSGILIEGRDAAAQALTRDYIQQKKPVLFQPVFQKDGFLAAVDILEYNPEGDSYSIYEVKATNEIDEKVHSYDLAFQVNLLRKCGVKIDKMLLIHLNKEYVRSSALNIETLFQIEDVTQTIEDLLEEVAIEMDLALQYLSQDTLPPGFCSCVYKGRSGHCTTFSTLNPDVPEYSVHDIARIGVSKKKLADMVNGNTLHIHETPTHIQFSPIQKNQIDAHKLDKILVDKEKLARELGDLVFPLYFIDYETLPSAIPRFRYFTPYQQIPFQYSLYVLESPEKEPVLLEFLHVDPDDPTPKFAASLRKHIGDTGSVIVWHKSFECGRNKEIAERIPEMKDFIDSLNNRVFDLEEIFKKQNYVHKDFRGSTSIKKVLPVLVPSLSYSGLAIQDGGSAADIWRKLQEEGTDAAEKERIAQSLKEYCGLDAYAMYAIWRELYKLVG